MKAFEFVWDIFRFWIWGGLELSLYMEQVWILGLLSLTSLTVCLACTRQKIMARWRSSYWLIFSQLLFFPIVVAVGMLFRAETGAVRPNVFGVRCLYAIIALSLALGCFWIYRLKGLCWLAVSLVVLQEALLSGTLFIAGMSVTGDWI